jgi:hypothetical protein
MDISLVALYLRIKNGKKKASGQVTQTQKISHRREGRWLRGTIHSFRQRKARAKDIAGLTARLLGNERIHETIFILCKSG